MPLQLLVHPYNFRSCFSTAVSPCLLRQLKLGTNKLRNLTAYFDATNTDILCAMAIVTADGKTTAPQPDLTQGCDRSAACG